MGSVFRFSKSGWLNFGVKQMASDSVWLAVWLTGICSSWHGNSPWHRLAPLWDGFLLWMGKHAKFKVLLPVCAQQQGETQLYLLLATPWLTPSLLVTDLISRRKETCWLGWRLNKWILFVFQCWMLVNQLCYSSQKSYDRYHMCTSLDRAWLLHNSLKNFFLLKLLPSSQWKNIHLINW